MRSASPIESRFEQAFDELSEPVAVTLGSAKPSSAAIIYVNAAFAALVAADRDVLRGKTLRHVVARKNADLFRKLDNAWRRSGQTDGPSPRFAAARPPRHWRLHSRPLRRTPGSAGAPSYYVHVFSGRDAPVVPVSGRRRSGDALARAHDPARPCDTDMSECTRFARSLTTLHDISSDTARTFGEKAAALLGAGCDLLDLPIGIVSHVTGDRYEVAQVVCPEGAIAAGQVFDLAETYCRETLKAGRPIGFERASDSAWARHPCYRAHRLEAYLGAPIIVNEAVYGTLNFSSPEPRAQPFRATDREILALMAEWIGLELSRQQTLSALEDREARIRTITDGLPSRISYVDRDIRYRFVNKAYEVRFGVPQAEIVGKSVREVQGDDRYPALEPLIRRALAGETLHFEWAEGTGERQRFYEVTYIPDRGDGGDVLGFHALIHDITKLKHIQSALAESVRRQAAILDNIPDIAWLEDVSGRFIAVNGAFARARGTDTEALLGLTEHDIWPEGSGAGRVERYLAFSEARPRRHRHETRMTGSLGEEIWVDVIKTPIFDTDGTPLGATGIARDITQRKEAEAALFREKERAQVTLHSIADAVITTDADGRVDYLNPVAETLTGWRAKEARGAPVADVFQVVDETSGEPLINTLLRCLEQGETSTPTTRAVLLGRDGRSFAIEDTAAPIRQRNGDVLGMVVVFRDVTEKRRALRQLAHDASHDALTGLINRREFERRLDRALVSAARYGHAHAVCYLDLDNFKIVNDTAGHTAGDQVLRQVRGLVAGAFRERDTFARIGGDEFGLLLDNCALTEAVKICEIIASLFQDFVFSWEDQVFRIGISIGIVPIYPTTASASDLLEKADAACYAAKKLGRGRVCVLDLPRRAAANEPIDFLHPRDVRDALGQNRLCLFAQPIVPLAASPDQRPRVELLLRCRNPRGNLVPPAAFLPVADRSGLMAAIDHWVIATAFDHFGGALADPPVDFSINLSDSALGDPSLIAFITHQRARHHIAPERVCFEIAEASAHAKPGNAQAFVREVRAQGFRVAIDNFGGGVSSLACLRSLPADYLKISGRAVTALIDSSVDRTLVAAINDIAHALKMQTIANHVDCGALLSRLGELGVDHAQGWALGPPTPLTGLLGRSAPFGARAMESR